MSFQVYVMNADGSEARKLADASKARRLANNSAHPVWSPDGRKIAFAKQGDIYVMNADGSGQRNLTRTRRHESQPVWSPAQR